jgi:hypothetical protein
LGIGLALTKQPVEMPEGTIEAHSAGKHAGHADIQPDHVRLILAVKLPDRGIDGVAASKPRIAA